MPETTPEPSHELDLRGEVCPYTLLKTRLALEELPPGTVLRVLVDSEASARDVPLSLTAAGQTVLCVTPVDGGSWLIGVRRRV